VTKHAVSVLCSLVAGSSHKPSNNIYAKVLILPPNIKLNDSNLHSLISLRFPLFYLVVLEFQPSTYPSRVILTYNYPSIFPEKLLKLR
jgi:hypothetical protein